MRKAIWAFATLAAVILVSLGFDTSCANPDQLCRGTSINRRFVPNTTEPEDVCTECVEATCCDLIGDCQGTSCANEVAATHACVVDAGRAGALDEPGCRDKLRSVSSKNVYQCMRDNCDDECLLPTCRLDPLVPALGTPACDRCFAQSCCSFMNACAKNRTCLLALRCIIDECRDAFVGELRKDQHAEALTRKNGACGGGFDGPPDGATDRERSCFANCIQSTFVENNEEAAEARCLAAQINECGADVDCGRFCDVRDASVDGASSDAAADAATDAPADAPAD